MAFLTFRCRTVTVAPDSTLVELKGGRFMWVPQTAGTVRKNTNAKKLDYIDLKEEFASSKGLI